MIKQLFILFALLLIAFTIKKIYDGHVYVIKKIHKKAINVIEGYTNKIDNDKNDKNKKCKKIKPFTDDDSSELTDFTTDKTKNKFKEFQCPNKYKFKVKYDCRKTATGMFTDCGPYSADIDWSADPYKALNCKICKEDK